MSGSLVKEKALFVVLSLLMGAFFREINKKTHFPFTPMLLIAGIIWGGMAEHLGMIGASALSWENIGAHTILIIFIPALIYESAFGTDWHTFKRELAQTLLLAGPGVIVSTILTA
jgi:NhaP-type Na+/H+ or K+/H+ antiporter